MPLISVPRRQVNFFRIPGHSGSETLSEQKTAQPDRQQDNLEAPEVLNLKTWVAMFTEAVRGGKDWNSSKLTANGEVQVFLTIQIKQSTATA